MFAEQVSDDLVVDMVGLPSFAYATNRVRGLRRLYRSRSNSGSGRTRYRTIIPKDTEEYRKFVSFGAPKSV